RRRARPAVVGTTHPLLPPRGSGACPAGHRLRVDRGSSDPGRTPRPAPRACSAARGRQHAACSRAAPRTDTRTAPPRPAAAKTASVLRSADGAPAPGRGTGDLHPPREQCGVRDGPQPEISDRQAPSGSIPAAGGGYRPRVPDGVPQWPPIETLAVQTLERLTDT